MESRITRINSKIGHSLMNEHYALVFVDPKGDHVSFTYTPFNRVDRPFGRKVLGLLPAKLTKVADLNLPYPIRTGK